MFPVRDKNRTFATEYVSRRPNLTVLDEYGARSYLIAGSMAAAARALNNSPETKFRLVRRNDSADIT